MVSMTVKKQECLSLPPYVKQTVEVELPKAQRRAYQMMKKHLIAEMEEGTCVAQLAVTKALRLLQIASGYIPVVQEKDLCLEAKVIPFKENPKAKALKELLSDLAEAHKILVWAVFHENYAAIREVCDGLKLGYVEVTGERTPRQKQEAVDRLNHDPDVRVLIGHPGSGGIGINLIAASYSIFYSRNFSLEYDLQAEARNYRGGSNRHPRVTRIDIVAKDTIDRTIAKALGEKKKISDEILLADLKEETDGTAGELGA
jgi:SNF2 family DNA or RNA helicase